MQIPVAKAGVVFGRGGDAVRDIISRSGAQVQISREPDADGFRSVTISGGAPQAAAAVASEGVSKDGRRIRFCAFVSHMKAEAAMAARFRPEKVTASRSSDSSHTFQNSAILERA